MPKRAGDLPSHVHHFLRPLADDLVADAVDGSRHADRRDGSPRMVEDWSRYASQPVLELLIVECESALHYESYLVTELLEVRKRVCRPPQERLLAVETVESVRIIGQESLAETGAV